MIEFIFICNIAVAAMLLFWPVWFSRKILRLSFINPFTIVFAISLPVELMKIFGGPIVLIHNGLFDVGFQYAILVNNVYVITQTIGLFLIYVFCIHVRAESLLPLQKMTLATSDLKQAGTFFLFVFLLSFYFLASGEFGLLDWIANPREGYQLYRTGQGHWYALAISALSISFVLHFLARPAVGPFLRAVVLHIGLSYFLGSKGVILLYFGATLVFLWFLKWKHLTKLFFLGTPVIFAILIFNLYLALSSGFEFQSILEYFDYFKNAADYYRGYLNSEIPLFEGDVIFSSLWAYVPRALWPEKPIVYGILHINEIFYPGQAELTNTPAFGGAVEQFADFGWYGVVIFGLFSLKSFVTGVTAYLIFNRPKLNFSRVTFATILLLLTQFAPGFGTFFPGGLYLILLILTLILIYSFRSLRLSVLRAPENRSVRQRVTNDFSV